MVPAQAVGAPIKEEIIPDTDRRRIPGHIIPTNDMTDERFTGLEVGTETLIEQIIIEGINCNIICTGFSMAFICVLYILIIC
jgi:hypothetical protein